MRPDVIYWATGTDELIIESFEEAQEGVNSYDVFTAVCQLGETDTSEPSIRLPDNVKWANGVMPEVSKDLMELSISRISNGSTSYYLAVLTNFASV